MAGDYIPTRDADFNAWQRTVLSMRAGLTRFYETGMHCG